MRVGPDHLGVHQRRPAPRPAVRHGARQRLIRGNRIAAVHFLDIEVGEIGDQLGDRAAGSLDLDRHRDRVAVVLDQVQNGQLQVRGGVERLPELAFARRAVSQRAVDDLVVPHAFLAIRDRLDAIVAVPRLRASHGLKALRAGGTRLADDVELLVTPVRRHLPPARVGVGRGTDRREQHLGWCHAEGEAECPVAVIGIEPVVARLEDHPRGHQHRLVPGAGDLEEDLVLPLELDFLVVEPPRQGHQAIDAQEVSLGELSGANLVLGAGGHEARKIAAPPSGLNAEPGAAQLRRYTTRPPTTVARTRARLICSGGVRNRSRSSRTRSACIPRRRTPALSSAKPAYATPAV